VIIRASPPNGPLAHLLAGSYGGGALGIGGQGSGAPGVPQLLGDGGPIGVTGCGGSTTAGEVDVVVVVVVVVVGGGVQAASVGVVPIKAYGLIVASAASRI
jgi:hypothetical protein